MRVTRTVSPEPFFTPAEIMTMAIALEERGRALAREASSRKWIGPQHAEVRADLRDEARYCQALAMKARARP